MKADNSGDGEDVFKHDYVSVVLGRRMSHLRVGIHIILTALSARVECH